VAEKEADHHLPSKVKHKKTSSLKNVPRPVRTTRVAEESPVEVAVEPRLEEDEDKLRQ
jgi:hypothetical protein